MVGEVQRGRPFRWAEYRLKDEIFDDPHVWENGYLVRLEHEEVGGMTVVAPPVKFSSTPMSTTTASPTLGKHTREILAQAGLSEEAINRLFADGVVRGPTRDFRTEPLGRHRTQGPQECP